MNLLNGIIFLVLAALVTSLLVDRGIRYVNIFGYLRTVRNNHPGPCWPVAGDYRGAEDITLTKKGRLIVSSGLDTYSMYHPELWRGGQLLHLNAETSSFRLNASLEGNIPESELQMMTGLEAFRLEGFANQQDFRPHGIGIWEDESSTIRIFVVNHRAEEDYVEIFDWLDQSQLILKFVKGISVTQIGVSGHINDVMPLSPTTFYVTNDKYYGHVIGRICHVLGLPLTRLYYWDGSQGHDVTAFGYVEGNGVNLSPDKAFVYMTDPMSGNLHVFESPAPPSGAEVEKSGVRLREVARHYMGTAPDNIEVDPATGSLLIGCHSKLHLLFAHLPHPTDFKTPSQILRIHHPLAHEGGEFLGVTEVFADTGTLLSGSSVATQWHDLLFIGSVVDKVVVCQVRNTN